MTYTEHWRAELMEALGWRIEDGHITRPAWHAQAACRGVGTEAFFVEGRGRANHTRKQAVELYCSQCPVVAECREAGRHEAYGTWGRRPGGKHA